MSTHKSLNLRLIDTCLSDREDLSRFKAIIEKIEKCCLAVQKNLNLADIVSDPANFDSFCKVLKPDELEMVFQLVAKFALEGFETKSFTLAKAIDGRKKIDFIYWSVGGWKQFDTVLLVQFPEPNEGKTFCFLNPQKQSHWKTLSQLPAGTLITVFLKSTRAKRSVAEEKLATERYEALFETIQHRTEQFETSGEPVIQLQPQGQNGKGYSNGNGHSNGNARSVATRATALKPKVKPKPAPSFKSYATTAVANTTPVMSFKVVINKMDTFVHAGNAHLILNHVQTYGGKVSLYVLRGEKKQVRLDADSIWSAEIRNGETVLFEFFGTQPAEAFLKELAKKVNKYTQMDKLVNE